MKTGKTQFTACCGHDFAKKFRKLAQVFKSTGAHLVTLTETEKMVDIAKFDRLTIRGRVVTNGCSYCDNYEAIVVTVEYSVDEIPKKGQKKQLILTQEIDHASN